MIFPILGVSKKDDDRPYPGYRLKTGTYKKVSESKAKTLTIEMSDGCIPLSAYIYSVFNIGDASTSHRVYTNTNSSVINISFRASSAGGEKSASFNADLTGASSFEDIKKITSVSVTRSSYGLGDFSMTINKWLEPIE